MTVSKPAPALNEQSLLRASRTLARRDPDLARIQKIWGPPPLWPRKSGFQTLVHMILEQQVSLASAEAAFKKLKQAIRPVSPMRFLALSAPELKRIGFSRQKTTYCRGLARVIRSRELRLEFLPSLGDEAVRVELTRVKGIGVWTADVYLLMVLGRPDIWPTGDIALQTAVQEAKGLRSRPSPDRLLRIGEAWRPWRAVAARMLWHFYLSERGRS